MAQGKAHRYEVFDMQVRKQNVDGTLLEQSSYRDLEYITIENCVSAHKAHGLDKFECTARRVTLTKRFESPKVMLMDENDDQFKRNYADRLTNGTVPTSIERERIEFTVRL